MTSEIVRTKHYQQQRNQLLGVNKTSHVCELDNNNNNNNKLASSLSIHNFGLAQSALGSSWSPTGTMTNDPKALSSRPSEQAKFEKQNISYGMKQTTAEAPISHCYRPVTAKHHSAPTSPDQIPMQAERSDDSPLDDHHDGPSMVSSNKENQSPVDQTADSDPNRQPTGHHVGPVMGIFFKVWSLVKVTKVRHQQKMRRQNSEDASQFHYISGDQLNSGPPTAANQFGAIGVSHQSQAAILRDSHFRRAGSQPAPSVASRQSFEPMRLSTGDSSGLQQHQEKHLQVTAIAGNASGTSSGVSSTTSSTLANQITPNSNTSTSSGSGVRRHLSSYSLRRSTAEAPLNVAISTPLSRHPEPQKKGSGSGSGSKLPSSWTAKIKRSATSVNQADLTSYVSRYRFKRSDQSQSQNQNQAAAGRVASAAVIKASSQQAQVQTQKVFNDERHVQQQQVRQQELADFAISDEEDSNDIYSTPNDSIQSVPSTAPVIYNELVPYGLAVQQAASQAYPIIKSFSTSNFSQLAKQQQQHSSQSRFKPIDELTSTGQQQQQQQQHHIDADNERDLQRQDSSHSSNGADNNKRLNGSRFFISSSSSEDSNSPGQQQQQLQQQQLQIQQQQQVSLKQAAPFQLEQQQQQLQLQHGVHYHSPPIRPDSLIVGAPGSNQYVLPISLFATPAASSASILIPTNGCPIMSAMSPLDYFPSAPDTSPFVSAVSRSRLILPGHPAAYMQALGYRKSPSLFEISAHNSGSARPSLAGSSTRLTSSRFQLRSSGGASGGIAGSSSFKPAALSTANNSELLPSSNLAPNLKPEDALGDALGVGSGPLSILTTQQQATLSSTITTQIPNSISLHDCKLSSYMPQDNLNQQRIFDASPTQVAALNTRQAQENSLSAHRQLLEQHQQAFNALDQRRQNYEYKLAQMMLEFGSNPNAKDANGCTALMQAVLSENLPAVKCLIEHKANLNETNNEGSSALDLVCSKVPTTGRLEMLKLLIENQAEFDRTSVVDGSRLLDRLIEEHDQFKSDKLPYIDCLLQSGAKLGSSTWSAASGKHEIQLRLLKKLCQDGYFLYKKSSIEAAVYRFEYALKRVAELEQQLAIQSNNGHRFKANASNFLASDQFTHLTARQIKYQTYLGLSRCERKRKFYKRALEFAHLAILVDSTAYEGYYSKAHILKDLGELDDSLSAIEQTSKLVDKSIDNLEVELGELQQQEEALRFDGCFNMLEARNLNWIESNKLELNSNLDYLHEAKKFISRLKSEILDDKLRSGKQEDEMSGIDLVATIQT